MTPASDPSTEAADLRSDLRTLLAAQRWGASTPRLQLLGFDVAIRTTDPAVAGYVTRLYAPMVAPGPDRAASHTLSLHESPASHYLVHLDGIRRVETRSPAVAFARLVWEANRQAIEHSSEHVLLHAAAAARGGRAVVIAGPMGAGKSTLVAALVRHGFAYLTDELVAIEPGSDIVMPYPKPIALGGFGTSIPAALEALRPELPAGIDRYVGDTWLVAPDTVSGPAAVDLVIVPEYRPGAEAALEALRPADALVALAEHAFHLPTDGQRTLDTLAGVAETAACFRLVSSDPDGASSLIASALAIHQRPT